MSQTRASASSWCRTGPCGRGSSERRRRGRSVLRASRADTRRPSASAVCGALRASASVSWWWPLVVGRVDGIEELLDAVDVLAGADELVLVDLRLRAGSVDLRDRVLAQENQPALADIEFVPVEGSDRRARRAIAFGVVLAAVAWAAEACRHSRIEDDFAVRRLLLDGGQAEDLA